MSTKKEIWDRINTYLKSDIAESEFKTWFSNTTLNNLGKNVADIGVPNKFVASWIHENYATKIQKAFEGILNFSPEIRFTFHPQSVPQPQGVYSKIPQESTAILHHLLHSSLTFDNFITAKSNRLAYSSAMEVSKQGVHHYNPLYIFSKFSLGKTHLLNAIGNRILYNNPSAKVRYDSAERFSSTFTRAARNHRLNEFSERYKNLDFFILDDIHLLSERKKTQRELTSLINVFYESKKQIVLTGNNTPGQIYNLCSQLRSRIEGGLITEIHAPDQKTKIRIIKKKAKEKKLQLPDDVAFFLANTTNNLKTIMQYLVSLEVYTSLYNREIDISTVKSIINKKFINKINLNINDIQRLTSEYFSISISDLLSNGKKRKYSYPRQVAMYLCRTLTNYSFKDIGKAFGNKDHSTVIYAVKRLAKEKEKNQEVSDDINKLLVFLV